MAVVSVALPACKSAVPMRVPPAMNVTVPVGLKWGRLRSATLAVRMTGCPCAVDRGLIERTVRVAKGWELGEAEGTFGAARGGVAGGGVVGPVEIGVGVGVGDGVGFGAGVGDGVGVASASASASAWA